MDSTRPPSIIPSDFWTAARAFAERKAAEANRKAAPKAAPSSTDEAVCSAYWSIPTERPAGD